MKKIMILGASILQLPAIQKAKELGLEVIAVDMNPDAIGFKEENVVCEVISTIDIPAVLECAKKHRIDAVMTLASDMPMRTVAEVAKELGLVGITAQTALNATNKAVMRQKLFEGGVPVPKFFKVSSEEEYREAVSQFATPFIVKPADNSGSRGVYLVDDIYDSAKIFAAYEHSSKYSRSGDVVIEEYMQGPEVSVETLTVDSVCHVIQITDKITTGAPHFVEMGHTQPSQLSEEVKQKIAQVAKDANRAIGITNGPSHTEIIVTKDGPKIVELGARLGGDCITTHLVPLSTGVNMVECCIKIALGEKPDIARKFNKAAAIRYFRHQSGVVSKISGVDEAQKIDGIKQISILCNVGDTIAQIDSSSSRIGFVIAQTNSTDLAVVACENAIGKIRIETDQTEA